MWQLPDIIKRRVIGTFSISIIRFQPSSGTNSNGEGDVWMDWCTLLIVHIVEESQAKTHIFQNAQSITPKCEFNT